MLLRAATWLARERNIAKAFYRQHEYQQHEYQWLILHQPDEECRGGNRLGPGHAFEQYACDRHS